jgi:CxxC motif-containing protein (DUF1111 family)
VRAVLAALLLAGCGPQAPGPILVTGDPLDQPLRGATEAQHDRFAEGDRLFDLPFRAADGLGPLYIRTACSACHEEAGRGSGRVEKMVVVEDDGLTASPDQSALPYGNTVRPYYLAPATHPLTPPDGPRLRLSIRVGPPLFGRGYLEAIADSELERLEAAQGTRTDDIRGRINRVRFHSEPNPGQTVHAFQKDQAGLIGRFGLKARIATLDDFTADAFVGDMGMTSPLRPAELQNPEGLTDDQHPGLDVDLNAINAVADYLRLIEIPRREVPHPEAIALFAQARCDACHVPALRTRADYPIAQLAGIDAPIYADLLLHDMGEALADALTDEQATSRQWRTAPLIGLRFLRSYLHDGRARTIEEAVRAHDGEAADARRRFEALSETQRAVLLKFVLSL